MNPITHNLVVTLVVSLHLLSPHPLVAVETVKQGANDLAEPILLIDADHATAAPFVADLDGDGKPELIVGEFRKDPYSEAGFRVYRRVGNETDLKFDSGQWLKADGRPAMVPAFCYTGSAPQIVDFDGDSTLDLVSPAMIGSRDTAVLRVFRGLGRGKFAKPTDLTILTDVSSPRRFSCYNIRTLVHDWDGDGDMDIIASLSGKIWLLRRTEARSGNLYAEPVPLAAGGETLTASLGSMHIADWDGDGREDLILGESRGSVQWFRNTAPRGEPVLATGAVLVPSNNRGVTVNYKLGEPFPRPDGPSRTARVCVADMTGDGRPDLIVGDWTNAVAKGTEPSAEQTENRKAVQHRLNVTAIALRRLESKDPPANPEARAKHARQIELHRAECRALYEQGQQLLHHRYERHGSVWLYRRLKK